MTSAKAFLAGIIDYAGLFPPAGEDMLTAVRHYAQYRAGEESDLLGRFVVPASRLDELGETLTDVLGAPDERNPWPLAVIADSDPRGTIESALEFNSADWSGSGLGHAICRSVEIVAADADAATEAAHEFPDTLDLVIEVPHSDESEPVLASIARTRAIAKIRTGGVTEDAFPETADVVRFIRACILHGVRFKATAGLHHAITGEYPLTYEAASRSAKMFGFVNLFAAAALLRSGLPGSLASVVLDEADPHSFAFDLDGMTWRAHRLGLSELRDTRAELALAFGSCSFKEPVEELRGLDLL